VLLRERKTLNVPSSQSLPWLVIFGQKLSTNSL
jgi:hypothetical protein